MNVEVGEAGENVGRTARPSGWAQAAEYIRSLDSRAWRSNCRRGSGRIPGRRCWWRRSSVSRRDARDQPASGQRGDRSWVQSDRSSMSSRTSPGTSTRSFDRRSGSRRRKCARKRSRPRRRPGGSSPQPSWPCWPYIFCCGAAVYTLALVVPALGLGAGRRADAGRGGRHPALRREEPFRTASTCRPPVPWKVSRRVPRGSESRSNRSQYRRRPCRTGRDLGSRAPSGGAQRLARALQSVARSCSWASRLPGARRRRPPWDRALAPQAAFAST